MASRHSDYVKGAALSAAGMIIISPDALLLRLIEQAGTWEVAFFRALFQGIAFLTFLALTTREPILDRFRRLGALGWLSALLLAGAQIGIIVAFTTTSAANTLVLLATMPLFGALFGWLLLRETVRPRTLLAIALALAGIGTIFADALGRGHWLGDGAALMTALLYGINLVILRKAGDAIMLPALCVAGFLASLIALPFAEPAVVGARDLGIIAWLGLVQIPVALVLFMSGTRYIPAAEVALMSLIETVLGPFLAWLGVGEVPPKAAFVGGGLVVLAIGVNSLLALVRPDGAAPQSARCPGQSGEKA